jgi:hypothetical protein
MMSVIFAECHEFALYAECHYAECLFAEWRYVECRFLFAVMLSVFMLNVIMLNAVAPTEGTIIKLFTIVIKSVLK